MPNKCAKYRTIAFSFLKRPLFPCFVHHYCLQILYSTKFLIENVLSYLFHWFLFIPDYVPLNGRSPLPGHNHFLSQMQDSHWHIEQDELHTCETTALCLVQQYHQLKGQINAASAPQTHAWFKDQPSPKLRLDYFSSGGLVFMFLQNISNAHSASITSTYMAIILLPVSQEDVITRHNHLQDCFAEFCRRACLQP